VIITADWLLPVSGLPMARGAVVIRGPRIIDVGDYERMLASYPNEQVEDFKDCVIVPGLVNAHTHLSLTVLSGLIPRMPLAPWLRRVTAAVQVMSDDDLAASAALGAVESLRCGVTCVGDIVYGPEPLAACADLGVGGVFYWEVLGIDAGDLSGELAEREFPSEAGSGSTAHARYGISPHTAYTSGPELIRACWNVAKRHHTGFAIHVAESEAERQLMVNDSGPLRETAHRLARGFAAPHTGTVGYLEAMGVLTDAVAVHCVHLEPGDVRRLKTHARGVVLCPRSNEWLGNGVPPASELTASGARVAIGTDSLASNSDLDLFEEARSLRQIDTSLTARWLLRIMTLDGARTLGIDDAVGSLELGKRADITVVRTGPTSDPESAVIRTGGSGSVAAVLTHGLWRVREGAVAFSATSIERDAGTARAAAEAALAQAG
jgi:aminodeoxyfutalosine deaminase